MNKIESSETIRKTTFNFYNYKLNLVKHKKTINIDFLQWFIGFTEQLASFIVCNNQLFFIINLKQAKILNLIKLNLGFGKVSLYKTYSRFIVADRNNIDRLIFIFNGNLRLNETNTRFASWLQTRNLYSNDTIEFKHKNTTLNLHDNAWLSGFIDHKGCFEVFRVNDREYSLGFTIRLRFIIDQRNEKYILNLILNFLGSGVIKTRKNIETMYRFTCNSISSHEKLIQYLTRYPLRSLKKVSFVRFACLLRYIKNIERFNLKKKQLQKVENLIKNIKKLKIESG